MTVEGRLYGCPIELALDLIGGKWKTVILARLKDQPLRYGELRRIIPDLSDKVLTQRLHELEEAGFIARDDEDGQVRYDVTMRGRSLQPALEALYDWGEREGERVHVRFREIVTV